MIKKIVVAVVLGLLLVRCAYINFQDEQSVIISLGVYKYTVSEPGLKFKLPWESRFVYPKRVQAFNSPVVETITRDKQNLCFDSVALYKITDPYKFYIKFRRASDSRYFINDVVYNAIRILAGKYNFYDLIYIKRDDILKEAAVLANNSTGDCGIEIEEVMFKRVFFPESNLVPIYNSMIAERQQVAETYRIEGQAEYDKIVSEANKYRAVEIAKAKGQAQKIVGDAEAESQRMIQSTMAKTAGLYELLKTYDVYLSSMDNIKMIFKPDGYLFKELKAR